VVAEYFLEAEFCCQRYVGEKHHILLKLHTALSRLSLFADKFSVVSPDNLVGFVGYIPIKKEFQNWLNMW